MTYLPYSTSVAALRMGLAAGLLACAGLSWAVAAPQDPPPQKPHTNALAPLRANAAQPAKAGNTLEGRWHSVDAPNGALQGRILLAPDGHAALLPEGQAPLDGTWSSPSAGVLQLTMPPHGTSSMRYEWTKHSELVLVYENGTRQTFKKEAAKK